MSAKSALPIRFADGRAGGEGPSPGVDRDAIRLRAAASFFTADPARLRAIMAGFRRRQSVLESEVRGWSMTGTLPDRSRIKIRCGGTAGRSIGDVIAVQLDETLIVHRIAYFGRGRRALDHVITRGDSTLLADPPRPPRMSWAA